MDYTYVTFICTEFTITHAYWISFYVKFYNLQMNTMDKLLHHEYESHKAINC